MRRNRISKREIRHSKFEVQCLNMPKELEIEWD